MKLQPMQCQEREYSRPGGRWMDCRRQPHRGEPSGSERVQPQTRSVYLIPEDASSGVTPQCAATTLVKTLQCVSVDRMKASRLSFPVDNFIPSIASIPVNFFLLLFLGTRFQMRKENHISNRGLGSAIEFLILGSVMNGAKLRLFWDDFPNKKLTDL